MTKLNTPLKTPITEYLLGHNVNPNKYKFSHHPSIVGIMEVTRIVPLHLLYEVHSQALWIVDDAGQGQRFEFRENLPCEMSNDNARKVWERLVELGWRAFW